MNKRIDSIIKFFRSNYGTEPEIMAKGPGRVDLMGNHTDYNEGYVLPVALDVDVIAAGRRRNDGIVRIMSTDIPGQSEFSVSSIEKDTRASWTNYVRGVLLFIQQKGYKIGGADVVISSTVPIGSGLSSSAALEMASGYLFQLLYQLDIPPVDLALIGQSAENKFVGVNTGIMDQFISRLGKKDQALFIDCRTLSFDHVPLDSNKVRMIICDTKKRRGLVGSEYDLRREQCNEAVKLLSNVMPDIKALRDVSVEALEEHKSILPSVVANRAEHVVRENQRVLDGCQMLRDGDYEGFGILMNESHVSAASLYEVSCFELESMVKASMKVDGVLSARLAGAGFGGCTVSLVMPDAVDSFLNTVPQEYKRLTGIDGAIYVCDAADGASQIAF